MLPHFAAVSLVYIGRGTTYSKVHCLHYRGWSVLGGPYVVYIFGQSIRPGSSRSSQGAVIPARG